MVAAQISDGDGSTRVSQPLIYGPMWGGLGRAPARLAVNFLSQQAAHGIDGHSIRCLETVRQAIKGTEVQ